MMSVMNCLGNIESSPNLRVHQWFNEWFSLIFIPWVFIYLSKVTYLLSSLINDKHRCLVLTQFLTCIVFNVHIYLKNFKVSAEMWRSISTISKGKSLKLNVKIVDYWRVTYRSHSLCLFLARWFCLWSGSSF